MPHGGGKKIDEGSLRYKRLLRWIAEGAAYGRGSVPEIVTLEVEPALRTLPLRGTQQLRVTAIDAAGQRRCVTAEAEFESNAPTIAAIDRRGWIEAGDHPGEAAMLVRYLGHVTVARITLPRPGVTFARPPEANFIDKHVWDKLARLGIPPSDLAGDAEFLRRVYLDTIGTLPNATEARTFLSSTDPKKRAKLIDALLDRPEYADYWSMQWADLLRVDRDAVTPKAAVAMTRWLRREFAENRPFDEFARAILDRARQHRPRRAGRFLRGRAYARGAEPLHRATLLRRPDRLRPVPPSSVGSMGSRRLLRAGRVLLGRQAEAVAGRRDGHRRRPRPRFEEPAHRADRGGAGARGQSRCELLDFTGSANGLRRLDDRPGQSLFRAGDRQPAVGALLRPRPRRTARRLPPDQSAHERTAARGSGQAPPRLEIRPEGLHADALELAGVSTRLAAASGQRRRCPELLARRRQSDSRRGAARCDLANHRRAREVQRRRPTARGPSNCGTTVSHRTSSASSAGRCGRVCANANGRTSRASRRRCT